MEPIVPIRTGELPTMRMNTIKTYRFKPEDPDERPRQLTRILLGWNIDHPSAELSH